MTVLGFIHLLLILGVTACATSAINAQTANVSEHPAWMSTPKAEIRPDTDAADQSVRLARSRLFNVPVSMKDAAPDLTQSDSVYGAIGGTQCYMSPEQLPVAHSDVVAVGSIIAQQPYLTEDHRQIYSELTFNPENVLKNSVKPMHVGESATILGQGGSIKLANGRSAGSIAFGGSDPIDIGRTYLLFMKHLPDAVAYRHQSMGYVWASTARTGS